MSSDEEKLDDGASQEMESDDELTDLEDEVQEEMVIFKKKRRRNKVYLFISYVLTERRR